MSFDYSRIAETLAEADCNVIGDQFYDYCPDCLALPLTNATFGWGAGANRSPWRGDRALIVEGETETITPCYANRMLRFEATYENDPVEEDATSTSYQLIDLRDVTLAETVTFVARALFNRRQVDNETDRTFRLALIAYSGDPATFDPNSTAHQQLGGNTASLVADARADTWEAFFTELTFPSANIDFLLVSIAAIEDVVDDGSNVAELDAHFVDYVRVGYTGTEHDLGLTFRAYPSRVSGEGQVVFELILTNHTPDVLVTRPGVATEFYGGGFFRSGLFLRYTRHTGAGVYDPARGTWHLSRLAGGEFVSLYIAMQAERGSSYFGDFWETNAAIIDSPGDNTPSNNRRTLSLHASTTTVAPILALSDTTVAVGDTLTFLLFTDPNFFNPTFSIAQSHPDVAALSVAKEGTVVPRHHLTVVGQAAGETTIVVGLESEPVGSTADFFTLTVIPLDTAPQADDDSYVLVAGQTLTVDAPGILANDTDAEGETLTALLETSPDNGTLVLDADGGFIYTPDAGFAGDTFTYRAEDEARGGMLQSEIATVTLALAALNRPPVAVADTVGVTPGVATELDLLANDFDPDGDPLTVSFVGPAILGTTEIIDNGQAVRYTPNPGFVGTDAFGYLAADDKGATSFETQVLVEVGAGANSPPVANDDTATTTIDTPVTINVLANDTDVDGTLVPATVSVTSAPTNGSASVSGANGTISYTPNGGFSGTDSLTYLVADDDGVASNEATVTITVNAENTPPTANDDAVTTLVNTPVTIDVLANDTDVDGTLVPATVSVTSAPTNGSASVSGANGTISYTPNGGFTGTDTFAYLVADDDGAGSNEATVTVTVNTENTPPTANDDQATTTIDTPVIIDVLANDTDPDGTLVPATVSVTSAPTNGTAFVSGVTGYIFYYPNGSFTGTDSLTYLVADDDGAVSNEATVFITVIDNRPPVAVADTVNVAPGVATDLDLLANDFDPDGDTISITAVGNPTNGSVEIINNGQAVRYTPDSGFTGDAIFGYVIVDEHGAGSTEAVVTITVAGAHQ